MNKTASLALSLGGAAALAVACTITTTDTSGGGSDGGAGSDSATGGDSATNGDSGTGDETSSGDAGADVEAEAAPPPVTYVRVAHLSPDAPAVDFCYAAHGTTQFTGPVLAGLAGVADAGADAASDAGAGASLAYTQVSAYVAIPPGQYDVRVVAAPATSCATGLFADATSLPTLAANGYATIAAMGDSSVAGSDHAIGLAAFVDDATAPAGQAALRAIHASPSMPALDLGTGSIASTNFAPLFAAITYGTTGQPPASDAGATDGGTIDSNGYVPIAALASATISAHTSTGATSDAVVASQDVSVAASSVATLFIIGAKTGDATHPLKLLLCQDNAASSGLLASCSVVSP
jgi:hypothetical protein